MLQGLPLCWPSSRKAALAAALRRRYVSAIPSDAEIPEGRGPNERMKGTTNMDEQKPKQLLHLVFGGELSDLKGVDFKDLDGLDIVGIFPDYASAQTAWRAKAQQTVDNAAMRYFIVHLHRLLEPDTK